MSTAGNEQSRGSTPFWKRPWVVGITALVIGVGVAKAGGSAPDEAASSGPAPYSTSSDTSAPAPVAAVPSVAAVVPAPAPAPAPVPAPVPAPAPLVTRVPAPAPAPQVAPAPAPAPAASVVYANCDDVRAHGAAPIHPGDPGFQPKFDRDNDGVGCEN
jgi:hypothetical protein